MFTVLLQELRLDGGGACGKPRTSCAGGVTKQKPGVAASTPFWEVGLVPREEGASGEVEKTNLPRADLTSGLEAHYRGRRTNALSCHEAGSCGGHQCDEERRMAVPRCWVIHGK